MLHTTTARIAYIMVSKSPNTKREADTIRISVRKNSLPVLRCLYLSRRNLTIISVPPVVAPALKTIPSPMAMRIPPARAASSGCEVSAPNRAKKLVNTAHIKVA